MRSLFIIGVLALTLLALPGAFVFAKDLIGDGPEVNTWLERNLGISHRLALGLPAATLLFCLLPMIVLLYFLRLKRQPIAVPSTFLWKKSIEDLHVNRLMQWLRKNVLLLLQLLAVLLFIYAALGPRMHGAVTGGRHYILMIDNSASMSATDVKPNRLEWAKAEAIRTIDAATDADPGMLIVFNTTAEIRQSYTANREELKAAVRSIEPSQFPTRIDEALALAASRANPTRSTENESAAPANPEPGKERTYFATEGFAADIFLFSDGRFPNVADFPLENLNIQYPELPAPSVNGTSNNLAIVRFTAERDAGDPQKVLVRGGILNFRDQPAELKVQLDVLFKNEQNAGSYTKQIAIPAKPQTVAVNEANPKEPLAEPKPGEAEVEFTVPEVPENADVVLVLSLVHPGDALPLDDTSRVVLGVARRAKVLVVTPGNKLLRNYFDTESAKKLAEFAYILPRELSSAADYLTPAREGKYDLVIFDRCAPPGEDQMPTANTFFIGFPPPPYKPLGSNDPKAVTAVNAATVRGWLSRHPLMNKLRGLDEIRIAEKADLFRFPDLPPRTPKLLEGDAGLVLMAAISRQSFTDVVLVFPLATANEDGPDRIWHSDWPMLPSFVLFLQNMVKILGNVRDTNAVETLQPGQIVPLRPGSAKEVYVTKPGAKTATKFDRGSRSEVIYSSTDTVGVYTAEWAGGQLQRFAVNLLDPEESNLAPVNRFTIGDTTVNSGEAKKEPRELWKYGVIAALAVVLLEWWVYNRRVQI